MGLFRRLFGPKKPSDAATTTSSSSTLSQSSKEKKRWSFVRSSNSNTTGAGGNRNKRDAFSASFDDNKHAIAVAAATAAVAEAALAAAQAAAEVVRLTGGSGRCAAPASEAVNRLRVEALAAVRIQSAFRGYLARRALRALKALVKLQALVRGHIVRKQTADMLRRMQTLVRVQTRVRASRTFSSDSLQSGCRSCHSHYAKAGSMDGLEKARIGSYRLDRWMEECLWSGHGTAVVRNGHADDDRSDKILEVDTWEPKEKSLRSNHMFKMPHHALASDHLNQSFIAFDSPSKSSTKLPNKSPSFIPREVSSFNSLKLPSIKDDAVYRTAENSPQVYSASSRPGSSNGRGPFTPTRSECSWGFFNGYSGYPSYMAYTESSRAKFRSQSAPRQRIEFERYGSKKQSLQGSYDAEICSERSFRQSNESRHKAYPPSSRLNRLGSTNVR